jgi:hypothetical protein
MGKPAGVLCTLIVPYFAGFRFFACAVAGWTMQNVSASIAAKANLPYARYLLGAVVNLIVA